jgi:hypothetical protein
MKMGEKKISIHNYITSTQEFIDLSDDIKDVEEELTKLGYDINNIQYMVMPSEDKGLELRLSKIYNKTINKLRKYKKKILRKIYIM